MNKFFLMACLALTLTPLPAFSEDGEKIYKLFCSQCHGRTGNGKGINSESLTNNPLDHTDSAYMSSRTDKQLEHVIKVGGIGISKSPVMPSWDRVFTDAQIKSLVAYLRKLCNCKYESIISNLKLRSVDPGFR
ncbi:MAG: c-type cytochrome [Nitrospinota bacterium]